MIDLSIILVNYRSAHLIIDCLRTVYEPAPVIDFEVIVVNNGSSDNDEDLVRSAFPQIKWINMNYNAGFARANNEAIRQSSARAVLLLNSDTLVQGDAIQQSFLKLINSEHIACGVQLLNFDGTPQISGNYFMKGSLNNLLPLPYTGNFIKWLGQLAGVRKPNVPNATTEINVDWINGAYLMVKQSAIKEAGLMNEDFFLYAEEAEWCSRLNKVGSLCIYGQYHVVHLQGETSNEAFGSSGKGYYNLYDRKGLQIMLSNMVRIRKQFGVGWYLFHLMAYVLEVPVFLILGFLHRLFKGKNPFGHFRLLIKFIMNVAALFRFLPPVLRNKPYFYKVL